MCTRCTGSALVPARAARAPCGPCGPGQAVTGAQAVGDAGRVSSKAVVEEVGATCVRAGGAQPGGGAGSSGAGTTMGTALHSGQVGRPLRGEVAVGGARPCPSSHASIAPSLNVWRHGSTCGGAERRG